VPDGPVREWMESARPEADPQNAISPLQPRTNFRVGTPKMPDWPRWKTRCTFG
jgi:hypothetical protein